MTDDLKEVTLATLGGGAAAELFEHELQKVLADCLDPNTDPEAKRAITMRLTIAPSEDRESAAVSFKVESKLAGPKPVGRMVFIGKEMGRAVAYDRVQYSALPAEADAPARTSTTHAN